MTKSKRPMRRLVLRVWEGIKGMSALRYLHARSSPAAGERGAVLPLVALMMVVLVGFVAFAIDWGQLHEERRSLQNTADAAALAGAKELPATPGSPELDKARQLALSYVQINGVTEVPTISFAYLFTDPSVGYDTIIVSVQRQVNTFFAGVIGTTQRTVSAQSRGLKGSAGIFTACILPLAALQGAPGSGTFPFEYYPTVYTMKESAPDSITGNRGGIDLYDQSEFFPALAGNCPGGVAVTVGDYYKKHEGNWGNEFFKKIGERLAGANWAEDLDDYASLQGTPPMYYPQPAYAGMDWEDISPRFIYVPIFDYDEFMDAGNNDLIQLKGVGVFFTTFLGCEQMDGSFISITDAGGSCPPGKGVVQGSYLKVASLNAGATAWNPYGTDVIRLWQ